MHFLFKCLFIPLNLVLGWRTSLEHSWTLLSCSGSLSHPSFSRTGSWLASASAFGSHCSFSSTTFSSSLFTCAADRKFTTLQTTTITRKHNVSCRICAVSVDTKSIDLLTVESSSVLIVEFSVSFISEDFGRRQKIFSTFLGRVLSDIITRDYNYTRCCYKYSIALRYSLHVSFLPEIVWWNF